MRSIVFFLLIFVYFLQMTKADISSIENIEQDAANRLNEFIRQTSILVRGDPQQSAQCFEAYTRIINTITEEYKTKYNFCTTTAEESKIKADEDTNGHRQLIQNTAGDSCSSLKDCEATERAQEYFQCAVDASNLNTRLMYFINNNATDSLDQLSKRYADIESTEERCKLLEERVYLEDTTRTYREMQECLDGKRPPPQTTTSTTTENTTATTTTTAATTDEEVTEEDATTTESIPTDETPSEVPYGCKGCNNK